MNILLLLLIITLSSAAEQKTFAEVYKTVMKDNNGRVTYDGESAVLVLFYLSDKQNETNPTFAQSFIVPNDDMTKLKINNFYEIIQKMKNGTVEIPEDVLDDENDDDETTDDNTDNTTPDDNTNTDNTNPEDNTNNGENTNPEDNTNTGDDTNTENQTPGNTNPEDDTNTENTTPEDDTNTENQPQGNTKREGTTSNKAKALYCRIFVNYRYSKPIKVVELFEEKTPDNYEARFPKFVSVRTELDDDSRVQSIEWDHDECQTCDNNNKKECFDNFCTFSDLHYGDKTCSDAQKDDKTACGFIIYFGWKGEAHAGFTTQYLKSYRKLPTHYTKYSKDDQFINAAADLDGDWLSF